MVENVSRYHETHGFETENEDAIKANLNDQRRLLQAMSEATLSGDWKTELREAIEQVKLEQAMMDMGVVFDSPQPERTLRQDQYFLDHSIQPKNPFSCDGLNVLVMISRNFLSVLLPICVLLFSLGVWLSEKRNGARKLLLWQARPKRMILLDKFLVSWLESTAAVFFSCLAVFAVCTLLFGIGETRYPVFENGGQILTTGEVILQSVKTIPAETFVLTAVINLLAGAVVLKSESD